MLPTESDLVVVATTEQHRWRELATAMKPRPFYRNEFIKFEDYTDNSEFRKALRMLQEWQHEHKDQATASNLKRSLAAVDRAMAKQRGDCCHVMDCRLSRIVYNRLEWTECVTLM